MEIGEKAKAMARGSDLLSILRSEGNKGTEQVEIEVRRLAEEWV
jgi:hypothetical protein